MRLILSEECRRDFFFQFPLIFLSQNYAELYFKNIMTGSFEKSFFVLFKRENELGIG